MGLLWMLLEIPLADNDAQFVIITSHFNVNCLTKKQEKKNRIKINNVNLNRTSSVTIPS